MHLIPPSYTLRLGATTPPPSSTTGLALTDKWGIYVLYVQLALSHLPGSLICAATGYITGLLWEFNLVPSAIKYLRLPSRFFRSEASIFQLGGRQTHETVVPAPPAEPLARNFIDTISGRTERPEIEGARERDVERLMGMFPDLTRERAVAVLGRSHNSVERAVEALLEG